MAPSLRLHTGNWRESGHRFQEREMGERGGLRNVQRVISMKETQSDVNVKPKNKQSGRSTATDMG